MSSEPIRPEIARQLELEERAHALRRKILSRPDWLASIEAGRRAEEQGDLVPIEELDRELQLHG